MADEEENEEGGSEESADTGGGGGGSKILLILTAVNLLISVGVIGLVYMDFKKSQVPPNMDDIAAHGEGEGGGEHGGGGGGEHGGGGGEHGESAAAPKNKNVGTMIALDQFTVNLLAAGSVNPRFVRANISIEVPPGDTEDEIVRLMPKVRNAIIDLFNSKRPQDLSTSEGRSYLKDEIRNTLNSFLVTGKVKGVFITNIAVTS